MKRKIFIISLTLLTLGFLFYGLTSYSNSSKLTEAEKKQLVEKTLIIPLNSGVKQMASTLAASLKGTVADLPSGEPKPSDADILVVLGKDVL